MCGRQSLITLIWQGSYSWTSFACIVVKMPLTSSVEALRWLFHYSIPAFEIGFAVAPLCQLKKKGLLTTTFRSLPSHDSPHLSSHKSLLPSTNAISSSWNLEGISFTMDQIIVAPNSSIQVISPISDSISAVQRFILLFESIICSFSLLSLTYKQIYINVTQVTLRMIWGRLPPAQ